MLYVFHGNDEADVRQKAFAFLEKKLGTDREVTFVTPDSYREGMFVELSRSLSLFGGMQTIVLDTLSLDTAIFEMLLSELPLLAASANDFIVIERELSSSEKKKFETRADKMTEVTGAAGERYNAFALADAWARQDKKSLWLLLMKAKQNGLTDEEIIGVLFWQIKTLRLAHAAKNASEAGLKPFVYTKAKRAVRDFTQEKLTACSRSLLAIYHDGHQGKHDTALALEKWVLSSV